MRATRFACLACGAPVVVGPNYPSGMPIPRTLELYCSACETINILYQPAAWSKVAQALTAT